MSFETDMDDTTTGAGILVSDITGVGIGAGGTVTVLPLLVVVVVGLL